MGDLGSIPGLGRSPGGGHGNLLQYSCLENPCGQRRLAGYSPQGRKESDMTERLSTHTTLSGRRISMTPCVSLFFCSSPFLCDFLSAHLFWLPAQHTLFISLEKFNLSKNVDSVGHYCPPYQASQCWIPSLQLY